MCLSKMRERQNKPARVADLAKEIGGFSHPNQRLLGIAS